MTTKLFQHHMLAVIVLTVSGCKFPFPADVEPDAPEGEHELTVTRTGFGEGMVTVSVSGSSDTIVCGSDCTVRAGMQSVITLTAMPSSGDVFHGWAGAACSGGPTCELSLQADTEVVAVFDQCDRQSVDSCDARANLYEQCDGEGRVTRTVACPMSCSQTAPKCADLDPSDDPALMPLNALMDVLAGTGQELRFPSSCTPTSCSINTDDGRVIGATAGAEAPSTNVPGHGRVFRVESMWLEGTVKVRGSRALVLLANGPITIRGVLDASGDLQFGGPGAQMANVACVGGFARSTTGVSAGGGGGGRVTPGARGGNASSGAGGGAGGSVDDLATLIPLRGGCAGGWVDELNGTRATWLGGGGGAVQLVSRRSIELLGGGVIDASGGGGLSGDTSYPNEALGGTGGGSGGSILLEAPTVTLDGPAVVLSAKGGGGSAAGKVGFNGADGGYAPGPAPGGANPLGAGGGAGGTESVAPQPGLAGTVSNGHDGGGGGGAVGRCRINTRDGTVTLQGGAALRCVRTPNTRLAERILP